MPEIPKNESTYWLFADSLKPEGCIMQFCEFNPEYTTNKGKKIPVFVLLGEDKERTGEFLLSTWNIENLEDLKATLGSNSDTWGTPFFTATSKPNGKIVLQPQPK